MRVVHITKILALFLVIFLLHGCVEITNETDVDFHDQEEVHNQQYDEGSAKVEAIDIIATLLEPIYHTREDAFSPFRFERYEDRPRHDRNELIAEEGIFDYQRFFTLIEGTLSEEELEEVLTGEVTAYEVLQGQPRIGSRSRTDSAVIVETLNGYYMIVSFSGPRRMEDETVGHRVWAIEFVDAPTLEDILRSVGVEESIHNTSLDLETTRVLLLRGLPPISHSALGFLFSDGENEYFLAASDWVYDPMSFPVADFFLPEELGDFTMYAGVFYATSEVLPFLLDRREVQARAYERFSEAVPQFVICEFCGATTPVLASCVCWLEDD